MEPTQSCETACQEDRHNPSYISCPYNEMLRLAFAGAGCSGWISPWILDSNRFLFLISSGFWYYESSISHSNSSPFMWNILCKVTFKNISYSDCSTSSMGLCIPTYNERKNWKMRLCMKTQRHNWRKTIQCHTSQCARKSEKYEQALHFY